MARGVRFRPKADAGLVSAVADALQDIWGVSCGKELDQAPLCAGGQLQIQQMYQRTRFVACVLSYPFTSLPIPASR